MAFAMPKANNRLFYYIMKNADTVFSALFGKIHCQIRLLS